ncbi:ribosomal protein S18 acetylase RimI-like enzyme [Tenacibaculum gallaicum]|uniref:Ribosomal protein S18 acetylase RimI-like enzyme n=1 Tax=Tenacibaculum gallaicum TaxID=561505 RepID=A0A3E0HH29_9FLAO|nr:GNAT family N-acetyltransferase [Tenacibaculum gallaicum]REH45771.1 ribosomal protein S18 acetylase RimI-like enzyme [Tenacibaculum gallaicum]
MNTISKLEFDTDIFGYPVGKIFLEDGGLNSFSIPDEYKLIYVFSKKELSLDLMDRKEVYSRKTEKHNEDPKVKSIRDVSYEKKSLRKLAFQSGKLSRFKLDPNFQKKEFEKLYSIWFEKSISFSITWEVLLFFEDNELGGFVTLGEKNKETAIIGLIAVNDLFRGRGIGRILVEQAISFSYKKGYTDIEVSTQGENLAAVNLYKKTKFILKERTYIYHLWQ